MYYLNQQVVQASITWKQCADLPTKLISRKSTIINDKVYCGGGKTDKYEGNCIVYCYDTSQDNWTTLPALSVSLFGLGQVSGKLVAVGGQKLRDYGPSNKVFTYDERSGKWKQTLPLMPTARHSLGVLSLQSALVVVGGDMSIAEYTNAVEIFKADTSQWYRTDPLRTACLDTSLVAIGNTCYALGGFEYTSYLNQAHYASVNDLLRNAVPATQTTHSGRSVNTQSAWKMLANTPTYGPPAAVLAGNLLAIGGEETSEGGPNKKEVYMFSPSTNSWIYISDLPEPQSGTAVTVLSSTEILVIGGRCGGDRVNIACKGTLSLTL